jgi:hypothetical protein
MKCWACDEAFCGDDYECGCDCHTPEEPKAFDPFRQGEVLGVECANLFEWALTAHERNAAPYLRHLYMVASHDEYTVFGRTRRGDNTILSEKIRRMGR